MSPLSSLLPPLLALLAQVPSAELPCGPTFTVRFTTAARPAPFTGRVLVLLSKHDPEPFAAQGGPRLEPVVACDVALLEPGEPVVLDARSLAFPVPLPDLERGRYVARALLDADPTAPFPTRAAGNPVSAPVTFEFHAAQSVDVELVCDQMVSATTPRETDYARLLEVPSRLLSDFHGRPVALRSLVHLPQAFLDEPARRFPVLVELSGFGATLDGFAWPDWAAPPLEDTPVVVVYPDPSCASGHSGFADSANEGPWGRALVEELLPAVERRFRGVGARDARVVSGHSSGGWGALWLMLHHPEAFGGCHASSPDPLDFHDFMGIDLYAARANVFQDAAGRPRPFAVLDGGWTLGTLREHSDREQVLRGGALGYFEAVLGPRGDDGPLPLWDRVTGAVDPSVARAWARQDLGRLLRERWDDLAPLLEDRISITVGDRDTYLLRGSVERFRRTVRELGGDVRVQVLSGDHFSVRSHAEDRTLQSRLLDPFRASTRDAGEDGP